MKLDQRRTKPCRTSNCPTSTHDRKVNANTRENHMRHSASCEQDHANVHVSISVIGAAVEIQTCRLMRGTKSKSLYHGSNLTHRPPNVPQRYANQPLHARYAAHARTFFLNDFVSGENKGVVIQIPKLVIRVRFPSSAPFFLRNSQKQFPRV